MKREGGRGQHMKFTVNVCARTALPKQSTYNGPFLSRLVILCTPLVAMASRKVTARTRVRGNGLSAVAATLTTAGRGFVEFHPSMSLENVPTLTDCLPMPPQAAPYSDTKSLPLSVPDANDAMLESVLADRFHVWTKVAEVFLSATGPFDHIDELKCV